MEASPDAGDRQDGSGSSRTVRARLWIGLACVAIFLLATVPLRFQPIGPSGIDTSHTWAINAGAAEGLVYGEELVFTYGPLGFISEPLDIGSNLLVASLARLALHLLLGIGLVLQVRRSRSLAALGGGLLLLSLAWSFFDLALMAVTIMAVWCHLALRRQRWWLLLPPAMLAGVLPLVKLSLGATAMAMLGMAVLAGGLGWWRQPRVWLAAAAAAPVLLVAARLSLGPLATIRTWLSRSLEIVSGYSSAMSLPGPALELAAGVALLLGWLVMTAAVRRIPELQSMSAILLPAVIVGFRLGFVRHDVHVYNFFGVLLGGLALLVLVSRSPRQALGPALGFLLVLGVTGASSLDVMPRLRALPGRLTGAGGVRAMARLVRLPATRAELAAASHERLSSLALPEPWVETLRRSPTGVGTLPWENLYCPANGLRWSPTPTCQLYQAYTRPLDTWSASRYAATDTAPRWIVVRVAPMGMRHPLFDAPATWIEILTHYRLSDARLEQGLLLLERLETARLDPPRAIGSTSVHLNGRGAEVPPSAAPVLAELGLEPTLVGAVERTLFRMPPVFLVLYRASGRSHAVRIVPEVASHGLLINRYPHLDPLAWAALWTDRPIDPVVRISITGPGVAMLRDPVEVRWMVLERPHDRPEGSPSPPDLLPQSR